MSSEEAKNVSAINRPPKSYLCMPRPKLEYGSFSVEAVQPQHIESIRQWRNAQMDILRQTSEITREQQEAYFREHIWSDMLSPQPKNLLLAYMENGNPIGYGGLVHIAWEHRRAEVSFLLETSLASENEKYRLYFSNFIYLIKVLAFQCLNMQKIFTETYANRNFHISVLEENHFYREGVLRHHVWIGNQPVDSIINGCIKNDE
jgi:RimJ/RimL family protein N-acetyltransferase